MKATVHLAPDSNPASANLALWAKCLLLGDGEVNGAQMAAERLKVPERVMRAVNAPMMTSDSDLAGFTETQQMLTSFAPLLRNSSAFFRALDLGMIRIPLRQRLTWITGAAGMAVTAEGSAIKVTRMASDNVHIDPVRSSGIVVLSKEFLAFLSTGGEQFLSTELRRAIVASVDTGFFSLITDGSTPTRASSGGNAIAAVVDCRYLFEQVALTAESRPLFVMSPDVARNAATLIDNTNLIFPDMGPQGGQMFNIPAMPVDGLSAGTLGLIDAAGLAGDALGVEIRSARHANIQLNDAPDSPQTASTTFVNLWQNNLVALQPEVYFGVERLRTNAYAYVSGVNWGSSDSPA